MRDMVIIDDGVPLVSQSFEKGMLIATVNPDQRRNDRGELRHPNRLFIVVYSDMRGVHVADDIGWLAAEHLLGAERIEALGDRLRAALRSVA